MLQNTPTKLMKSTTTALQFNEILGDVYEFGVEGKFLFASIMTGEVISVNILITFCTFIACVFYKR